MKYVHRTPPRVTKAFQLSSLDMLLDNSQPRMKKIKDRGLLWMDREKDTSGGGGWYPYPI